MSEAPPADSAAILAATTAAATPASPETTPPPAAPAAADPGLAADTAALMAATAPRPERARPSPWEALGQEARNLVSECPWDELKGLKAIGEKIVQLVHERWESGEGRE